jgi:hypothetical protein
MSKKDIIYLVIRLLPQFYNFNIIFKYGLNRMHSIIFLHQVGWFDGKRVDICP